MNKLMNKEDSYITYYLDAMRRRVKGSKEKAEAAWIKANHKTFVN